MLSGDAADQGHRPHLARVAEQEDLLGGRAVGDADEIGRGVMQVTQELVDVVGEHRGGVEPQVAMQVGQAGLDAGAQRGLVGQGRGTPGSSAGSTTGAALLDEHQVPVHVQGPQLRHLAGDVIHR